MSWITEIARPDIHALAPYQHAAWEPGLVRLHANELPWRSLADGSDAGLNRYPEPHPHALAARLAQFYEVDADAVLPCRGSDEAIDLLTRCYARCGRDAIVITPPTFGMYALCARVQGATIIEVPLRRESSYSVDLPALHKAVTSAVKLVYLCSPNNPTGNLIDRATVLSLAGALAGRALLVIDEAYVEFSGSASLSAELRAHPGLVILRTMSKAHGLAGARCGAVLAHPEIIALLRRVIQPYAVTQLTIEAVARALEPTALEESRQRVAQVISERERMAAALAARISVRHVWPSAANFLLVECADAGAALQRCHAAGLLVRDLRHLPSLGQAVRLSIGTPEHNDRLLEVLP
ncbi:MAG TPA: histidinol-phosphate transaminase [Steroidobacteraceae bacterium]|nr:histidinol-phosphate transaminase [Steroidobacteraceae bacterium]